MLPGVMRKPGVSPCIMVCSIYKRTDDLCGENMLLFIQYCCIITYTYAREEGCAERLGARRQTTSSAAAAAAAQDQRSRWAVTVGNGPSDEPVPVALGKWPEKATRPIYSAEQDTRRQQWRQRRGRHFGPAALLGSVSLRRRAVTNNVRCCWQSLPHNDHSTIVEYLFRFFVFPPLSSLIALRTSHKIRLLRFSGKFGF